MKYTGRKALPAGSVSTWPHKSLTTTLRTPVRPNPSVSPTLPHKSVTTDHNTSQTVTQRQPCEPDSWEKLEQDLQDCQRCPLAKLGRKKVVLGEGNRHASIMLIGEAPGFDEDRLGRPFVGRSGQKLDQIISAIGFRRNDIYVANVVKCRPPENRDPDPKEISTCSQFLQRQLALVRPDIILALGRFAANYLLQGQSGETKTLKAMRQKIYQNDGKYCICTYHPSALLRTTEYRQPVWDDVRVLRNLYDHLVKQPATFTSSDVPKYPVLPEHSL
ncbi:uracil-DNA glycosylase [Desulfurispira natronophila]|nr:uracil-DNA glycosylase [Desulfurispira natronophila]